MAKNVAVGLLRPPHVFFYEIDSKKLGVEKELQFYADRTFDYFSIYQTKHGFHLVGYPYSEYAWDYFSVAFPSDFTKKLKRRWNIGDPQVLRISEKWDLKTGKVVSPKPKFICGNFFLEGIMDYKVLYYAK